MKSIHFKRPLDKIVSAEAFKSLLLCFLVFFSGDIAYSKAYHGVGKQYAYQDTANKNLIVRYHSNGKVREKGYQGHYSNQVTSTGTYIGEWNTFDPNGKRIQSIYYHNDIPSKAFIEIKKYYQNGLTRSIERFNNYELYESEKDSIGIWKYYNNKGKLIKQIAH